MGGLGRRVSADDGTYQLTRSHPLFHRARSFLVQGAAGKAHYPLVFAGFVGASRSSRLASKMEEEGLPRYPVYQEGGLEQVFALVAAEEHLARLGPLTDLVVQSGYQICSLCR